MTKPAVSVVMSVHNGAPYLREAVDSILAQTFTDFEFIIVNDGSSDGSKEILESYRDHRLVLLHQENKGLTKSLNRAIDHARGALIARQDADDRSYPERLATQVAFLSSNQEIALVGSAVEVISGDGQTLATFRHPTTPSEIGTTLKTYNCFWHGSVMFRRDCFLALGGYDQTFVTAQDYDMWLRFSERYQLANLAQPLYAYRFTVDSVTVKRMVSQHRLAGLARRMAQARAAGGALDERPADLAAYLAAPPTPAERIDIVNNYKPWCRLLLKNQLPHEAAALMSALFRHHPSLLFRLAFTMAKSIASPSLLSRFLEHA